MIVGKITAKSQTTIPRAVRLALGLVPGDDVAWEIEDGRAVLTRVVFDMSGDGPFAADFSMFTEWADDLDSVYDNL